MFTANTELEITVLPAPALARCLNKFAYPSDIKACKGVALK